ncbi:MAG: NAD-dependent epimerase/dehydratase family protein [Gammaproteobacteria bacterium]
MKNAVLITGATGYIGRNLARYFHLAGFEVHAVMRASSDSAFFSNQNIPIRTHLYDGTFRSLSSLLDTKNIQTVIHLASITSYDTTDENIDTMLNANLQLGTYLLEIMRKLGCRRFINTGTYWQHFSTENYNPVCLYAATKQAFESIFEYYVQAHNFRVITLKLFDVYGPNDPRKKIFQLLDDAARYSKPLNMTEGQQLLDLVYIDDVINAYSLAKQMLDNSQNDTEGFHNRYHVSTEQLRPLKEWVELYLKISQQRVEINWGALPYRKRQVMTPYIGKILPQWKPEVCPEEGLNRLNSV